MKRKICCFAGIAGVLLLSSCGTLPEQVDCAEYVNPFIGTGGHGHTYPGAVLPHGMIQPGPDTRIHGWDACSGYYYADSTINGFSHTHLSGTGCGDYGDVLLMPTVGEQKIAGFVPGEQVLPFASRFSHSREEASPGYYSVFLDTYGVLAEMTATKRAALHRYTFPESASSGFILDLDYSLQGQRNRALSIEVVNDSTLCGYKNTNGWAWRHEVYFCAVFSKPFNCQVVSDTVYADNGKIYPSKKALLRFATTAGEHVSVKVALSAVDQEGAFRNLSEIPGWDFERVRTEARAAWNDYLSKIEVQAGEEEKEVFYTALYHTGIAPALFTDADGRYRGLDREVHTTTAEKPMYTIFSLWDTFRALHPLLTITEPELNLKFINALLRQYQDGGLLPMWELAGNYTGTMIGYHAVSVIVDAYMKGNRDFDAKLALEACLKSAEYDTSFFVATTDYLKHAALMPKSKYYKNTLGYIPCDQEHEAVAKALEYAYNDWCISVFAKELGDTIVEKRYRELAQAYRAYFDPSVRFMRGKDLQGNWRVPFSPCASNHREDDYCEGTAWQWTWFVPHDVEGLVDLMGGKKGFTDKLDSLFSVESVLEGEMVSADISGLVGQYAHGNEPSHHVIHCYNYVGEPWKTQQLADSILRFQYFNAPDGLSGNEDCGQMSAWYVLNAMGFYQFCPGRPEYSIGRPLFGEVKIRLPKNKEFRIVAKNNSLRNKHIASATLNGKVLDSPFFTHRELMEGGVLVLEMTDKPSQWGCN